MQALSVANIELQTRCVIEWQLLTMTRPSEASGTEWQEIDIDNKLWVISDSRMKMKREHVIPLSTQAIRIIEIMKGITGHNKYMFPTMIAPHNKPMSSETANNAIKNKLNMKGRLVAHGLRSLASTALNEQKFNPDAIEVALSHVDRNKIRRAYNHAQYLEERKIMMQWWGDFVEQASQGNVSLSAAQF